MLKSRPDNKGAKLLEAALQHQEKLEAEDASLQEALVEVERKLTAAFVDGTEAQRKALRTDRDKIEQARARLAQDRPAIAAAIERARVQKQAMEWESETAEQREIAARLRDLAVRTEEAG